MHSWAIREAAALRADKHPKAALLQYMHVMVVGVAHGPARRVPSRFLAGRRVYASHVAVAPLAEGVEGGYARYHGIVDVPIRCLALWHVRATAGAGEIDKLLARLLDSGFVL